MSTLRAFLVVLVALSVAMLPIAAGFAAVSPELTMSAGHADCCPDGQPCEKQGGGCGSLPGCVLKCSGLSTALPAPAAVKPVTSGQERFAFLMQSLGSALDNPPLPPPRV